VLASPASSASSLALRSGRQSQPAHFGLLTSCLRACRGWRQSFFGFLELDRVERHVVSIAGPTTALPSRRPVRTIARDSAGHRGPLAPPVGLCGRPAVKSQRRGVRPNWVSAPPLSHHFSLSVDHIGGSFRAACIQNDGAQSSLFFLARLRVPACFQLSATAWRKAYLLRPCKWLRGRQAGPVSPPLRCPRRYIMGRTMPGRNLGPRPSATVAREFIPGMGARVVCCWFR